jgi:glycine betaine/proline transport system permease protein
MIELPIGEKFETFVNWLKTTFQGFFDLVSEVLNFSITVLENTLLLNSETIYASIIFGLILALVVGLSAKRLLNVKFLLPVALVTALLFGTTETWRLQQLSSVVDTNLAKQMTTSFVELRNTIALSTPSDFSDANEVLNEVLENVPESRDRDAPAYKARDAAKGALRDIRRARSHNFDDVYDALDDSLTALKQNNIELAQATMLKLQDAHSRYKTFTLIEESDDLIDDLNDVAEGDSYQRRSEFINMRTYSRLDDLLVSSIQSNEKSTSELSQMAQNAATQLHLLNPQRLTWYPPTVTILLLALIAWLIAGRTMVVFTVLGLLLVISMDMWIPTVETLALVLSATLFALVLGVPLGVSAARSQYIDRISRPILDFMQTMPAFVYLIPAVIFFGLGEVPGAMATLIFAMPPAVRLTILGIRQVPEEVVEAAHAFGATNSQLLIKAQLPIAMPTILAGVNQTIMLALSMVVIGGMIGAGGLGEVVLGGITQMKLGLGFEGGIAVVILAIYLDRVTQALGSKK